MFEAIVFILVSAVIVAVSWPSLFHGRTHGFYRFFAFEVLLYSSLLFFGWGTCFKNPSLVGGILGGVATALLVATARVEERENAKRFGAQYAEYMDSTKMFVPFLF